MECAAKSGSKVSVSPLVNPQIARNAHEAVDLLPGEKTSTYQVHADSSADQLVISSFLDYGNNSLKLEISSSQRMQATSRNQTLTFLSLSAFAITETELKLIAAAAIIGLSKIPNVGYKIPAATGTPRAL